MDTPQLKIWKSDFGKAWVERNLPNINIEARARTFKKILKGLDIFSVLEVGCSAGQNLDALAKIAPQARYGIDPMIDADDLLKSREEKQLHTRPGDVFEIPVQTPCFDLVFTAGTMMHVAPQNMIKAVSEMRRASQKYILTIEYYSETEQVIPWRGYDNLLFKRDYAQYFPSCIGTGELDTASGFGGCNWWLFKK